MAHSRGPSGSCIPLPHEECFPIVLGLPPASAAESKQLEVDPHGWKNYRSAESDPEVCSSLLKKMVDRGWALSFPSTDALTQHLGVDGIILNKLGLISKVKPDGTIKHRLVCEAAYTPQLEVGGPDLPTLTDTRVTF